MSDTEDDTDNLLRALDAAMSAMGASTVQAAEDFLSATTAQAASAIIGGQRHNKEAFKAASKGLVSLVPGSAFLTEATAAREKLAQEDQRWKYDASVLRLLLEMRKDAVGSGFHAQRLEEIVEAHEETILSNAKRISELENLASRPPLNPATEASDIIIRTHYDYQGQVGLRATEVAVQYGAIHHWRFAFGAGHQEESWGSGPVGGGEISQIKQHILVGETKLRDLPGRDPLEEQLCRFVGCGNELSPATSAYITFRHSGPQILLFTISDSAIELSTAAHWLAIV